MSDSLRPRGLIQYSPWNSPGQNTGAGGLSLLQEIFPTQASTCVPSDNSFLSVRHEPTLRPWKGVLLPVIPLSQFSHPFNGDCGPMGTVRQGWTLASSLMGHRCHRIPQAPPTSWPHISPVLTFFPDQPQDHVNW